ncbi:MAG: gamma-glutamyltransferase [Rhodospirillales bacterium]|nr:MAG: gamma-glutamyltransferase [Rhodospirillales bacterium]
MAGCGGSDRQLGTVGFVEGFLGGVAADEPQAALIGRDVLSAGGNAADAVVAMYFASAVTLPSAASLGGGGVCLGFDRSSGEVAALEFLARSPAESGGDRPVAVPGNVRGFFAFHARFGRLRWSQLLAPAENLARFGAPVSRALAHDLGAVRAALEAEPSVRRMFGVPVERRLVGEGDLLRQVELAAVVSRIRAEGGGAFYIGSIARQLVDGANAAGGRLSMDDLRRYAPEWRPTSRIPWGNRVVHFAPSPPAGGAVAAAMWAHLHDRRGYAGADPAARLGAVAEAGLAARTTTGIGRANGADWLENPSAATFVAVDREGSAAVCAVTLNSLFGTGRAVPELGIMLAAAPGPGGRGATALGPMLVVNENVREFFFAGAAAGGAAAPSALIQVAADTLIAGERLSQALAASRVLGGPMPGVVHAEPGAAVAARSIVAAAGRRLASVPELGRVNAVACPDGLPPRPESCAAGHDPRGRGLATMAD